MGTLGYMSPEQVKGKPADQRSDIFSFGAILYEMLSGVRAFQRDSAAETMSAILREEPPDLSATNKNVQPGLERIVRHCLEKNPEERFHSAHDLAFDLQSLSGASGTGAVAAAPGAGSACVRCRSPSRLSRSPPRSRPATLWAAGLADRRQAPPSASSRSARGRSGRRASARTARRSSTAPPGTAGNQIYMSRPDSPESSAFGLPGADILAVSPTGELAVSLRSDTDGPFTRAGTLARVGATGGGAPRELLESVQFADWTPDGKELAVVRRFRGKRRLELPAGQGPLRDDRLDRGSQGLAEGGSDRVPGPSGDQR